MPCGAWLIWGDWGLPEDEALVYLTGAVVFGGLLLIGMLVIRRSDGVGNADLGTLINGIARRERLRRSIFSPGGSSAQTFQNRDRKASGRRSTIR